MKMGVLRWGFLVFIACSYKVLSQQVEEEAPTTRLVNVPPVIIDQPPKNIAFKEGETVELPCAASGQPRPRYYWQMNEKDFDPSGNDGRIAIRPGVGTLIFARPIPRDEGIYQCFAENEVGRALTVKINLRLAVLEQFNPEQVKMHSPQLGMPLTLKCIPPRSFPAADISWTYTVPGSSPLSVDFTSRVTMDPSGSLHFANVLPSDKRDNAIYSCFVHNTVMRSFQNGAKARINPQGQTVQKKAPEILWQSPKTQVALRGDVLRIKCIFSGSPTPRVDWERTGSNLPDRARTESFGQELVIEDVQFEDMGTYECQGLNTEVRTPIRYSFTLDVEASPFWKEIPMSIDAAEYDTATFTCDGDGLPKPNTLWFQNGIPLSKGSAQAGNDRRVSTEKTLTFLNMTQADAQVVQCNVTNKHGYVWANAYLNVLVEPPLIRDPPKQGQVAAEGQTINITCEVFGSPKPLVVWKKGIEQLTGGKFTIHKNGHLEITDVSLVDAGSYTCTAINRLGEASATGSLVVRRKTEIRTKPLDVMVYEGTEAKFTCTATTDPEEVANLQINWKKDGQLIDYALAQRVFQNKMDNSLTISGTISLDTGKYACVASNGLDEDEATAQLTVLGVPDPPRSVEVLCSNNQRKAEITWQPGRENYAPILNFIVQYNTTFNPDTWINIETNITQTDRRKEVILSPYSNFTFRVLARNKIGMSPPSLHTRTVCTTETAAPEKNPENVIGEGDLPNNLVIFWTPMPKIEQNGQGFKYILSWKRLDISNADIRSFSIDRAEDWHYVVPEKFDKPYIPFEITVKASNGVGDAKATAPKILGHSGEDEPETRPSDVIVDEDSIGSSDVTLLWSQVDTSPEVINGFFRGYRIQFGREKDWPDNVREQDFIFNDTNIYPRPRIKRAAADSVRVTLRHLPPFTTIKAQVRVLNKYYAGPPSEPITFKTKEGEPGPPIMLDVVSRGSTHFELKWEPPAEENGIIMGYNISYQTITGLNLGRLQYRQPIEGANILRERLTGLQPDTHYRVYLHAATRRGKGEPIFIDMQTTPSGPPSPPTFAVDEVNDTSVILSWVPSRGPNPGSVFYIEYRPRNEFDWLKSPDEVLDFFTTVGDLDPGTTYQIRVVSKNGEGEEAPSEWLEFRTSGVGPGRYDLKVSGWFYGILASLFLIIIFIILFMLAKQSRDEWWLKKEADIQDQVRTLQAQDAAMQMGVFNQYADTGSRDVFPDTSYGQPQYEHDKEDDFYEAQDQPSYNPEYPPHPSVMTEKPPYNDYPEPSYPPQDASYPPQDDYPPQEQYPSPEAPYPMGAGYPQYDQEPPQYGQGLSGSGLAGSGLAGQGAQPGGRYMNISGDPHNQSKDSFV